MLLAGTRPWLGLQSQAVTQWEWQVSGQVPGREGSIHLTGSHRLRLWPESCSKLPRKKCKLQSLCRRIARAQDTVYPHPLPPLAWVTP